MLNCGVFLCFSHSSRIYIYIDINKIYRFIIKRTLSNFFANINFINIPFRYLLLSFHYSLLFLSQSVLDLKMKIQEKVAIPFDEQRLHFAERQLEDGKQLICLQLARHGSYRQIYH